VCSNEVSTKQRKVDVDGRQISVYKLGVERESNWDLQRRGRQCEGMAWY